MNEKISRVLDIPIEITAILGRTKLTTGDLSPSPATSTILTSEFKKGKLTSFFNFTETNEFIFSEKLPRLINGCSIFFWSLTLLPETSDKKLVFEKRGFGTKFCFVVLILIFPFLIKSLEKFSNLERTILLWKSGTEVILDFL